MCKLDFKKKIRKVLKSDREDLYKKIYCKLAN